MIGQSLLMSPKMRQEYNLSLSRGTEKSKTFFSLGYLNDQGYVIKVTPLLHLLSTLL